MIYVSRLVEKATNMKVNYVLNFRGRTDYEVCLSDTESNKIITCDLADILKYKPEGISEDFVNVLTKAEIKLNDALHIDYSLIPKQGSKIAYISAHCTKNSWICYQDASILIRAGDITNDIDYIIIKYLAGMETVIPYTKEFSKIYIDCKVSFFKERFRLGYI